MPYYSARSKKKLSSCHPDLVEVMNEVIKRFDCTIVCGTRSRAAQELAYNTDKSNAQYGESPHNYSPALAVDAVPYPVDWDDTERMILFAGYVLGTAARMGIELKWGGDWDRDMHLSDNRFDDFPHFELAEWRHMESPLPAA